MVAHSTRTFSFSPYRFIDSQRHAARFMLACVLVACIYAVPVIAAKSEVKLPAESLEHSTRKSSPALISAQAAPAAEGEEVAPPTENPLEPPTKALSGQPENASANTTAQPTPTTGAPPPPATTPLAPSSQTTPQEKQSEAVKEEEKQADDEHANGEEGSPYNTMILVEGVAKYGLIGRGTDLLESDQSDPFDEKFSVGYFGAQATFGLMPAHSAFTLAGRLRGGAYLGHSPAMGSLGAAMLFGANFARKADGRSFSYAMGGLGVEFLPVSNEDLITIHASGGTVVGEFTLGAGLDFGMNNEVFIAAFGLQMGWGRLL